MGRAKRALAGRDAALHGGGDGPLGRGRPELTLTRPPRHFQTHVDRDGGTVHLRLSGELDLAGEDHLEATLRELERDADRLVLDLCGLSFIDSSGLRTILRAWQRTREDGVQLSVVAGSEAVQRTLRMTGLDAVLPLSENG